MENNIECCFPDLNLLVNLVMRGLVTAKWGGKAKAILSAAGKVLLAKRAEQECLSSWFPIPTSTTQKAPLGCVRKKQKFATKLGLDWKSPDERLAANHYRQAMFDYALELLPASMSEAKSRISVDVSCLTELFMTFASALPSNNPWFPLYGSFVLGMLNGYLGWLSKPL